MTQIEKQERKVLRLAKRWAWSDEALPLYQAVRELKVAEKRVRDRRRAQLKKLPIVYCRICKRRGRKHRHDVMSSRRKKQKRTKR